MTTGFDISFSGNDRLDNQPFGDGVPVGVGVGAAGGVGAATGAGPGGGGAAVGPWNQPMVSLMAPRISGTNI